MLAVATPATGTTQWASRVSLEVNLPHSIDCRASCLAYLVTQRSKVHANKTLELHREAAYASLNLVSPLNRAIPVKVAAKRLPVFPFSGFDLYHHFRNDAFYDLYNL